MSYGRKTKCRKGCCFTPFDVCAKGGNCPCHSGYREREEDVAAVISMEQARMDAARRLELPAWQRTEPRRKGK